MEPEALKGTSVHREGLKIFLSLNIKHLLQVKAPSHGVDVGRDQVLCRSSLATEWYDSLVSITSPAWAYCKHQCCKLPSQLALTLHSDQGFLSILSQLPRVIPSRPSILSDVA